MFYVHLFLKAMYSVKKEKRRSYISKLCFGCRTGRANIWSIAVIVSSSEGETGSEFRTVQADRTKAESLLIVSNISKLRRATHTHKLPNIYEHRRVLLLFLRLEIEKSPVSGSCLECRDSARKQQRNLLLNHHASKNNFFSSFSNLVRKYSSPWAEAMLPSSFSNR